MITTDIRVKPDYSLADLRQAVTEAIPVKESELKDIRIIKRALSTEDKSDIHYKMRIGFSLSEEREAGLLKMKKKVFQAEELSLDIPHGRLSSRPVVVGAGPAGLAAALILAEYGAEPIVVEEREKKISFFKKTEILDTECNVQFGEGGAGTYSDGKLKYGKLDKYKYKALEELVRAGADEEILYSASAHLGTDKLPTIVKNIREKIKSLGGEFYFSARLIEIKTKNGRVCEAVFERDGKCEAVAAENIILATGHSAKDVFYMLRDMKIPMEARGFGIGVRIEHPREYINKLVYGDIYEKPEILGSASYHLVTHLPSGRGVYSFCMCPGGEVVAAANEKDGIVTNGMSEYKRDGENSNSALLVTVTPRDFSSDSALFGIELQRNFERGAYALSNSYKAPATTLESFLNRGKARIGEVKPSYPIGVIPSSPDDYLPSYITEALREGILDFDRWQKGFIYPDAVLTGPETRTTSPVRVLRKDDFEAVTLSGLYPIGEGAGYAGGIVSSMVDGIKSALSLIEKRANK